MVSKTSSLSLVKPSWKCEASLIPLAAITTEKNPGDWNNEDNEVFSYQETVSCSEDNTEGCSALPYQQRVQRLREEKDKNLSFAGGESKHCQRILAFRATNQNFSLLHQGFFLTKSISTL